MQGNLFPEVQTLESVLKDFGWHKSKPPGYLNGDFVVYLHKDFPKGEIGLKKSEPEWWCHSRRNWSDRMRPRNGSHLKSNGAANLYAHLEQFHKEMK